MNTESIHKIAQEIRKDIGLLRDKHLYELERIPGNAKCSTLADRMEEKIDYIIDSYEEMLKIRETATNQEQFNLLSGLLDGLAKEIGDLSKKQPDGLVNSFKVGQINRVLQPIKKIMEGEKSRNSYSDVAVILSQYKEACVKYREKYYSDWLS